MTATDHGNTHDHAWRIVELLGAERKPYCVAAAEWRGSEKRAKNLALNLSASGKLFVAEAVPLSERESI
jgi:hypothetical protein